ncbi:GUN4 domain protein [Kalymmatonema gypsitolerans NIES-4073]|nr:GUN4 domain protein [Scytonema sp. NIES-4073]
MSLNYLDLSDVETLANLLLRSQQSRGREALCIKIGLDPYRLWFIKDSSDSDFVLQLIKHLDDIGDKEALCKLCCEELSPIFHKGIYAPILSNIAAKLNCNHEIRQNYPNNQPVEQPPVPLPTSGSKSRNKLLAIGGAALGSALTLVIAVTRLVDKNGQGSLPPIVPPTEQPTTSPTINPNRDFSELEKALKNKDWKVADQQTKVLMLKLTGSEDQQSFRAEDFQKLSCPNLSQINSLWEKFSTGNFGFRSQQELWEKTGNYNPYAKQVGWMDKDNNHKNYDTLDLTQSAIQSAPRGHLPAAYNIDLGDKYPFDNKIWFKHVKQCL